jgi:hypothetical protein
VSAAVMFRNFRRKFQVDPQSFSVRAFLYLVSQRIEETIFTRLGDISNYFVGCYNFVTLQISVVTATLKKIERFDIMVTP